MWFKNARLYRFTNKVSYDAFLLSDALEQHQFAEMTALQESAFGWVRPFIDGQLFCEAIGDRLFITAKIQEKILPPAVLNEELTKRVDAIEAAEGRRPGRKEKNQLKEELRTELLPRAFHKTQRVSAWIDNKLQFLVVNCASEKTADSFVAHLRESIGALPVVPVSKQAESGLLTSWYSEPMSRPEGLEVTEDLKLIMTNDPTVKATYKNLDLEAPEVRHSIESGMRIVKMGISLGEDGTCKIDRDLTMTNIDYADMLIESAGDGDDPRTDALLMSDTLTKWFVKWVEINE